MRIFSIAALVAIASAIKLREAVEETDGNLVLDEAYDQASEALDDKKQEMREKKEDAEEEFQELMEGAEEEFQEKREVAEAEKQEKKEAKKAEFAGDSDDDEPTATLAQKKGPKDFGGDGVSDDKPDDDDEEELDLEFEGEVLDKVKEELGLSDGEDDDEGPTGLKPEPEELLAQEMGGESDEVKGDGSKGDKPSKDGDFSDEDDDDSEGDSEGDSDLEYLEELDAGELVEEFLGCLELKKEMEDVAAEFDITLETGLAQEVGEDFEGLSDEDKRAKVKDCLLKKKEIEGKIDEAFEEMEE